MCSCKDIHAFACYLRNIATDANVEARQQGSALNTDKRLSDVDQQQGIRSLVLADTG